MDRGCGEGADKGAVDFPPSLKASGEGRGNGFCHATSSRGKSEEPTSVNTV
jgi:hypothetical protein